MAGEGPHAIIFPTTSKPHPDGTILLGLRAILLGLGVQWGLLWRDGALPSQPPRERSIQGQGMGTAGEGLGLRRARF